MVPLHNGHRKYCIVVGCDSSYLDLIAGDENSSKLRFHKFPFKYPKVLRKWKSLLPLKRELQKHSVLCSKHFTTDSYTSEAQKRLSRDAVPSLFIDKKKNPKVDDIQMPKMDISLDPKTNKQSLYKLCMQDCKTPKAQSRGRKISSRDHKIITKDRETGLQEYLNYFGQLWEDASIACPDGDESILLVVQPIDEDSSSTSNEVTYVKKRRIGTIKSEAKDELVN